MVSISSPLPVLRDAQIPHGENQVTRPQSSRAWDSTPTSDSVRCGRYDNDGSLSIALHQNRQRAHRTCPRSIEDLRLGSALGRFTVRRPRDLRERVRSLDARRYWRLVRDAPHRTALGFTGLPHSHAHCSGGSSAEPFAPDTASLGLYVGSARPLSDRHADLPC